MIDPQSQAILEDIVRRESRSLLSYMHDAYPWTTSAGDKALARLRQVVQADGEAVSDLGAYLARNRVRLPYLGAYPMSFTSLNFIALDFLLPRLVKTQQELITALETDLGQLAEGEAKERVRKVQEVKHANLEALKELSLPAAA